MKLTIPFESEKEVTIPVPCFWKEPGYGIYVAILDDETFVRLYDNCKDYASIQHGSPEHFSRDIREAYLKFNLCDETEFMRAYSDAFESIRLHPKEVTTANCYSENH